MDAPKKVKVREVRLYSRPASLRMPFHFGNAKIEYLECALLRTIVEDEHGTSIPGIGAKNCNNFYEAGYMTPESIISASDEELLTIPGVGISFVKKLRKTLGRV